MKHLLSTLFARRQLAGEIDALCARASAISERHARYAVYHALLRRSPSRLPAPRSAFASANNDDENKMAATHLMPNRQLIHTLNPEGVDKDMKKLKTWMENVDKHSDPAVLSIVGFGGVGKTTIATKLYRDFGKEFDCSALVTVSQYYDEDQVLMDILGQIKPRDGDEEQQDRNTGVPAEKNLAAGTKEGLVKRLVPLLSGRRSKAMVAALMGGTNLLK